MAVRDLHVRMWCRHERGLGTDLVTFHSLSIFQTGICFSEVTTGFFTLGSLYAIPSNRSMFLETSSREPGSIGLGLGLGFSK